MNLESFLTIVDRVGAPMAVLIAIVYVLVLFVRGPAMRLAEIIASPARQLCVTATSFITSAAQTLGQLPAQIERESVATRTLVTTEATAVREHVSEEVTALRDRVSAVEHEIQRTSLVTPHAAPSASINGAEIRQ